MMGGENPLSFYFRQRKLLFVSAVLESVETRVESAFDLENIAPPLSAILSLPGVRARVAPMSVELYESLTEQGALAKSVELIRGIVLNKMSKSPLHSTLVKRIFLFLLAFQRSGLVVFSERPLRLLDSVPEPDAMIVRGQESDYADRHPATAELVVEVAVSSVALDRENASLYAGADVSEYWIVLGKEKQVEVYRQPENGVYRQRILYSANETLTCASVPDLQVVLTDWFV